MSVIRKELKAVTGVRQKANEDPQTFFTRIIDAIDELDEDDWDELSKDSQNWYNAAVDAKNEKFKGKKIAIPNFTDEDEEDDDEPASKSKRKSTRKSSRRVKPAEDEDEDEDDDEQDIILEDLMGKNVSVKVGRKTITGRLEDIDDGVVYIDLGEGEEYAELDEDKIKGFSEVEDEDDEDDDEPASKSKRGRGTSKRKGSRKSTRRAQTAVDEVEDEDEPAKPKRGRGTSKRKGSRKSTRKSSRKAVAAKPKRGRGSKSSGSEDVPIGKTIREIVCGDLELTKEEVREELEEKGIEFKDGTVDVLYGEIHKTVEMLEEFGKLK